jgi:hypothetical protein
VITAETAMRISLVNTSARAALRFATFFDLLLKINKN